jgi:transposase
MQLDTHADEIRRYVVKGLSKRSIAKLVGCAESTLYDWLARRRVLPHVPVIETRS